MQLPDFLLEKKRWGLEFRYPYKAPKISLQRKARRKDDEEKKHTSRINK